MPPGQRCRIKQIVRDHIPLEQGLRRDDTNLAIIHLSVRDHIPLEQGLRRLQLLTAADADESQRPYSIRTRIKTAGSR